MNTTNDRIFTDVQPLAIDLLLTNDERRPSSIERVIAFRESIASPDPRLDEIDLQLDADLTIDPYVTGTNSRRSDKELNRMLDLIDNLPISTNGKAGEA